MRELSSQINAKRTSQRNAWYFGAVKAFDEKEHDAGVLQEMLGITALQIENARRYIKRIAKIHPDRKQMSFEPLSILRKVEEYFYSDADRAIEADFLMLSQGEQEEMERKIRSIIKTYKLKSKNTSPENLKMIYWGCLNLNKE